MMVSVEFISIRNARLIDCSKQLEGIKPDEQEHALLALSYRNGHEIVRQQIHCPLLCSFSANCMREASFDCRVS